MFEDEGSVRGGVAVAAFERVALVLETDAGLDEIGVSADQEPEIVQLVIAVEDFGEEPGVQEKDEFGGIDLVGLGSIVEKSVLEGIADDDAIDTVAELDIQPVR